MAYIEWSEDYETGIIVIDQQHRVLIGLVNRLEDSVAIQNRGEVVQVFAEITHYIDTHFSYEESLFAQSSFRFAGSHIRSHRRFAKRMENFRLRLEAGGYITRELLNFLHRWVHTHIAFEDQQYVADVQRVMKYDGAALWVTCYEGGAVAR